MQKNKIGDFNEIYWHSAELSFKQQWKKMKIISSLHEQTLSL